MSQVTKRDMLVRWSKLAMLSGAAGMVASAAQAQQIDNQTFQTDVNVAVHPVAFLEFQNDPLLYLEIPPAANTISSDGVEFLVTGNALATLTAKPDAFIEIDGPGHIGKAVRGSEEIGYQIQLWFPDDFQSGSGVQTATLPGDPGEGTPPLSVDLTLTGGERTGELHLLANHDWTPDGGLPLPGIYEGEVVLTLTADNV